jgi:hypothetical protein|tara:strand:- start:96 stop:605 length:510 start_codon:yes stop_codon:yes gene_type:complete
LSNIIEVPFKGWMINNAKEKSENLGAINNSILKGKGNFAGYLGEEIVAHYIKADIVSNSEYNHDLLKNNQRIEVKTKRRTVEPQDHYDASVAYTSRHQSPDLYIFTSIQFKNGTPIKAWICGKKEPKEYFKKAIFHAKGDIDPSNQWKVSTDCYNLPYEELDPLKGETQ